MRKVFTLCPSEYMRLKDNYCGLCMNCGETTEGCVEPDARARICEFCEEATLYGVEELLIMGRISIEGDE